MDRFAQLSLARAIAAEAHANQRDKMGRPYLDHCRRVAERLEQEELKAVAYLHDVADKTDDWSLEKLEAAGVDHGVVEAVEALTRRPHEDETHFIARCAANALALPVKAADLQDNLVQADRAGINTRKYRAGLVVLRAIEHLKH